MRLKMLKLMQQEPWKSLDLDQDPKTATQLFDALSMDSAAADDSAVTDKLRKVVDTVGCGGFAQLRSAS